jgi:hypothetical protein
MVVELYSLCVETGCYVLLLEVETEKLCKAIERMAEDIHSIRIVDFKAKQPSNLTCADWEIDPEAMTLFQIPQK